MRSKRRASVRRSNNYRTSNAGEGEQDDSSADRRREGLERRVTLQLGQDGFDVVAHAAFTETESLPDRAVGGPVGKQPEDLELDRTELRALPALEARVLQHAREQFRR